MALFSFLNKKSRGNTFEDKEIQKEASQFSLEKRQLNAELRKLRHKKDVLAKQIEIQELKQQLDNLRGDDETDNSDDGMGNNFMNLLMLKLLGGGGLTNPQPQSSEIISPNNPIINLSDEELKTAISQLPKKTLKIAKNLPDNAIKAYISKYFNVDDNTLNRAVNLIKEK